MLQAKGLGFDRGRRRILHDVDLQVGAGEVVALLGANGAGKTTLLRCLLGLLQPSDGQVLLEGRPLSGYSARLRARQLAYVPQAHVAPFPYRLVDVVALGRLPHHGMLSGSGDAEDLAIAGQALSDLGIGHLAGRPYTEVSGGERQLALIARALVQGARTLVLDEPMSGLDFGHQMRLLAHIERLAAEGYAILKTTHHPDHALACASRVALLHAGTIEADGPAADVLSPAAMRRLYAVDVRLIGEPRGRQAFVPAD